MNTLQLTRILEHDHLTKPWFLGVFASDQLTETIERYPFLLIVNADTSSQPGSHWLAMYFSSESSGEFYDSYGNNVDYYSKDIVRFTEKHARNVLFNSQQVQSNYSTVCGQHCLFYLIHRSRHVPMQEIVNFFSPDKIWNDLMVEDFISKHFQVKSHTPKSSEVECLVNQWSTFRTQSRHSFL